MSVIVEQTIECEICGKKYKTFGGMENWSIQDKYRILSLCEECSEIIKEYIKKLKKNLERKL